MISDTPVRGPSRTLDQYLDDLEKIFKHMEAAEWHGVPGVIRFDSGKPGPAVGITVLTHGNEPAGLAVFEHFLNTKIRTRLVRGSLFLVVNNLAAAKKWFASRRLPKDQRPKCRFLKANMNRLPKELLAKKYSGNNQPYEFKRARSLAPIWEMFTHGMDIHSTVEDVAPMIITGRGDFRADLVRGFPIMRVIEHIDAIQVGSAVYGFFGGMDAKDVPILELEAGTHLSVRSFERAIECAEAFLTNLGMLPGVTEAKVDHYEVYRIFGSFVLPAAPENVYRHPRPFQDFSEVEEGETLAYAPGHRIIASTRCHILFGPDKDEMVPDRYGEEMMFFAYPVEIQKI